MTWFDSIQSNIVQKGAPLMNGREVDSNGIKLLTDDMWPASGYTVISANTIDEAVEIAKTCPSGLVRVFEHVKM